MGQLVELSIGRCIDEPRHAIVLLFYVRGQGGCDKK